MCREALGLTAHQGTHCGGSRAHLRGYSALVIMTSEPLAREPDCPTVWSARDLEVAGILPCGEMSSGAGWPAVSLPGGAS